MKTQSHFKDDHSFTKLSKIAYDEAGLVLSDEKISMIKSRLRHRMEHRNCQTLEDYCKILENTTKNEEISFMISALTTNVSSFFREPHHFDYIKKNILHTLLEKASRGEPVRIWSAGCSNGQEPYSIAIMLAEYSDSFFQTDCKILATDVNEQVINFGEKGIYSEDQIRGVSFNRIENFFVLVHEGSYKKFIVSDKIRSIVSFRSLNLQKKWPMRGLFDIIFCRNVVIYFDSKTQNNLWPRFYNTLHQDGILLIGHSERVNHNDFEVVGATVYAKKHKRLQQ